MSSSTTKTKTLAGILIAAAVVVIVAIFFVVHAQDRVKYRSGITASLNHFLDTRQECLWSDPIQMPARVDVDSAAFTAQLNALVDAGLLDRAPAAERHGRHEARVYKYTLSDMGQLHWTRDRVRQDYGNFCFGHMQVSAINRYEHVGSLLSRSYEVNYRDAVMLPAWAQLPTVQKAFPRLVKAAQGETDYATVVRRSNGWRVETDTSPGQRAG